ncbi:hypothetical protein KGF56_001753, partial [Candida oxycetoniae]
GKKLHLVIIVIGHFSLGYYNFKVPMTEGTCCGDGEKVSDEIELDLEGAITSALEGIFGGGEKTDMQESKVGNEQTIYLTSDNNTATRGENNIATRGDNNTLPARGGNNTATRGENNTPPTQDGNNTPPTRGGNNTPPTQGENNNPPTQGGNNTPPTQGENNTPPTQGEEPPQKKESHSQSSPSAGSNDIDDELNNAIGDALSGFFQAHAGSPQKKSHDIDESTEARGEKSTLQSTKTDSQLTLHEATSPSKHAGGYQEPDMEDSLDDSLEDAIGSALNQVFGKGGDDDGGRSISRQETNPFTPTHIASDTQTISRSAISDDAAESNTNNDTDSIEGIDMDLDAAIGDAFTQIMSLQSQSNINGDSFSKAQNLRESDNKKDAITAFDKNDKVNSQLTLTGQLENKFNDQDLSEVIAQSLKQVLLTSKSNPTDSEDIDYAISNAFKAAMHAAENAEKSSNLYSTSIQQQHPNQKDNNKIITNNSVNEISKNLGNSSKHFDTTSKTAAVQQATKVQREHEIHENANWKNAEKAILEKSTTDIEPKGVSSSSQSQGSIDLESLQMNDILREALKMAAENSNELLSELEIGDTMMESHLELGGTDQTNITKKDSPINEKIDNKSSTKISESNTSASTSTSTSTSVPEPLHLEAPASENNLQGNSTSVPIQTTSRPTVYYDSRKAMSPIKTKTPTSPSTATTTAATTATATAATTTAATTTSTATTTTSTITTTARATTRKSIFSNSDIKSQISLVMNSLTSKINSGELADSQILPAIRQITEEIAAGGFLSQIFKKPLTIDHFETGYNTAERKNLFSSIQLALTFLRKYSEGEPSQNKAEFVLQNFLNQFDNALLPEVENLVEERAEYLSTVCNSTLNAIVAFAPSATCTSDLISVIDKFRNNSPESRKRTRLGNRERKKRWREENFERNKDNELKMRVLKTANKKFGIDETSEKQAWIENEIVKRKAKRSLKPNCDEERPESEVDNKLDNSNSTATGDKDKTVLKIVQDENLLKPIYDIFNFLYFDSGGNKTSAQIISTAAMVASISLTYCDNNSLEVSQTKVSEAIEIVVKSVLERLHIRFSSFKEKRLSESLPVNDTKRHLSEIVNNSKRVKVNNDVQLITASQGWKPPKKMDTSSIKDVTCSRPSLQLPRTSPFISHKVTSNLEPDILRMKKEPGTFLKPKAFRRPQHERNNSSSFGFPKLFST